MKESKGQSEKQTCECSECGNDNIKMYMAALFLVGIILGAFMAYSYVGGQKVTNETTGVCSLNGTTLKNTTAEAAAIEKVLLFMDNELLGGQEGFSAKIVKTEDVSAKALNPS